MLTAEEREFMEDCLKKLGEGGLSLGALSCDEIGRMSELLDKIGAGIEFPDCVYGKG